MKNKKVVIDIDGVIADFEKKFCNEFGHDKREEYSLEKRYPSKEKEIRKFVDSPSTYAHLDTIPIGIDIVKFLHNREWNINIVSYRPDSAFGITYSWLCNNKVPFFSLSAEKSRSKIGRIKKVSPVFAVDDSGDIAESLEKISIPTILIAQPWNRDFSGKFPRIENFSQFLSQFYRILDEE